MKVSVRKTRSHTLDSVIPFAACKMSFVPCLHESCSCICEWGELLLLTEMCWEARGMRQAACEESSGGQQLGRTWACTFWYLSLQYVDGEVLEDFEAFLVQVWGSFWHPICCRLAASGAVFPLSLRGASWWGLIVADMFACQVLGTFRIIYLPILWVSQSVTLFGRRINILRCYVALFQIRYFLEISVAML